MIALGCRLIIVVGVLLCIVLYITVVDRTVYYCARRKMLYNCVVVGLMRGCRNVTTQWV